MTFPRVTENPDPRVARWDDGFSYSEPDREPVPYSDAQIPRETIGFAYEVSEPIPGGRKRAVIAFY